MEFGAYQSAAKETSKLELGEPTAAIAPMLGLASETGAILNVYKRYLSNNIDLAANKEFLQEELGDLLWYLSAVATACDLELEDIAQANLRRVRDRYPPGKPWEERIAGIPSLDEGFPDREQFPRRLVIKFAEEHDRDSRPRVTMVLHSAEPNPFPNGPVKVGDKDIGFRIGDRLGAHLTDNSRRLDAYRFHDAIHIGFMAVLGWSPTMRALLGVKRRSREHVDHSQDGARAIFAEEGLAAVLSRLAERRLGFTTEASVDGDALVVVKAASGDLEVEQLPGWLWLTAVSSGFRAKRQLETNHGGFLLADLDKRQLTYSKSLS